MKKTALLGLLAIGLQVHAQVSVGTTGSPVTIDFTGFTGVGFDATPAAGQLDSDDWRVAGFSDGPLNFGGSASTGDLARGTTTGNVTTGGLYAFNQAGNTGLLLQPTSSDFNPGSLVLRFENNTGTLVTDLDISYIAYIYNNEARANSFNLSYSYDDSIYTPVPALDLTSVEADENLLYTLNQATSLTGISWNDGSPFYLQWSSADVSGTGSRDEFGLDDISLTAYAGVVTPLVSFDGDASVTEGDGTVNVGVSLTVTGNCTVYLSDAGGGTATAFSDYVLSGGTELVFTEGGATTQFYTVAIANDALLEFTETIVLTLDSVSGTCAIGGADEATITLYDNEAAPSGPCANLFFSEYIEGSANNKALEIFNPTSSAVDLNGYVVQVFNNGGTTPTNTLLLTGLLPAGETYHIVNASADSALLLLADTTSSVTFFNGNDAVVLFQGSDTVDVIGRVGEDPIIEWAVDTAGTAENTLVRKVTVNSGQTNWTIGATEWDVYAQNTFSFFGTHSFDACEVICEAPENVEPQIVLAIGAKIIWDPVPGSTKFQTQYRPVGSSTWLKRNSVLNNVKLPGLMPATTYEYRVKTFCEGASSDFTAIQMFTTPARAGQVEERTWNVYPNPASAYINIDGFSLDEEAFSVSMYSITGQCLYSQNSINAGQLCTIPVPAGYSGTVLVHITKGAHTEQYLVVIE